MESFVMRGIIEEIKPAEVLGDKFTKQEFVLHQPGQYEQHIKFICVNTRIPQLLKVKPGDRVRVTFNVYGKPWKNDKGSGINQSLQAYLIDHDTE